MSETVGNAPTGETLTLEVGGKTITFETGRIARQASGSIIARAGGNVILAAAVADSKPREGVDFLPLQIDYREKFYAAGKFPGGFFKREGRPGDPETLKARLIDRPLRPLFPEGYYHDTQVFVVHLSTDRTEQADVIALTAAATALYISEIPLTTPVAAVRVGRIDDQFVVNPTFEQMEDTTLDLVVAGTPAAITMVEAGASIIPESVMIEALELAHREIRAILERVVEFGKRVGKKKFAIVPPAVDEELRAKLAEVATAHFDKVHEIRDKAERETALTAARDAVIKTIIGDDADLEREAKIKGMWKDEYASSLRQRIIKDKIRADGRRPDEIRPIWGEAGLLPGTHGSALFTRGQTQALGVVTLGTVDDQQKIDNIQGETYKRFMLHYNFPPFSVGETRRIMGPGRREIGHGALAERALVPVLPDPESFPQTIRIVSEIMESNGSSSMASVCVGSMAMMDAGVPTKAPVAGIAMGLIKEGDEAVILSDILGLEDHLGDMDFKVTGTAEGITALQMDIKIEGITTELMAKALEQARAGRLHIMERMSEIIDKPRAELSPNAPRILTVRIPVSKIASVIGPQGKVVKGIVEQTGAKVDIEDDGTIYIASSNAGAAQQALEMIQGITSDVEIGKIYRGKVTRVMSFGAIVEILPGKDGMCHISELDERRVREVEDICREGDMIAVQVIGVEDNGRVKLSRKAALRQLKSA
ncbi:MAG: polyribonucleotide nucleotidyltransferase [Candidatus Sumerlaeia bacterium]|nr:polyribonucleotide nucleotidyltransferase [Candidatus Sumerlaeia bacterium]